MENTEIFTVNGRLSYSVIVHDNTFEMKLSLLYHWISNLKIVRAKYNSVSFTSINVNNNLLQIKKVQFYALKL